MLCLSIRQPWLNLILAGGKRFEFRSWRPVPDPGPFRAMVYPIRLALQASRHKPTKAEVQYVSRELGRCYADQRLPMLAVYEEKTQGCILGTVEVVACWDMTKVPADKARAIVMTPGYGDQGIPSSAFAWELQDPVRLVRPVPVKGRLGLFEVSL